MIITKSWTWLNVCAVTLLSIFIYIPFVFMADLLPDLFGINSTASIVFGSPLSYFIWILFVGMFSLADVFFSLMDKEWNTSLHTIYNSIKNMEEKEGGEPVNVKQFYVRAIEWNRSKLKEMVGWKS